MEFHTALFLVLFFFCYINDLPRIFNNGVKSVLFADDTSLIISNYNYLEYRNNITTAFVQLNEWFNANLLTLNYNKPQYIQFRTKADSCNEISLSYHNNFISNNTNTKFLGIIIDSSLTWKTHLSQLLPKLSRACYIMRNLKPIMSSDFLKMVYYSYFHSIFAYGIML
jgi:hypothetical protein